MRICQDSKIAELFGAIQKFHSLISSTLPLISCFQIMKLLRLNLFSDFYHNLNCIKQNDLKTCDEILTFIKSNHLITPVTFTESMNLLGWEAKDCLINDFFLKQWALENGCEHNSFEQTIENIIADYKPEVLYLERTLYYFKPNYISYLKKKYKFIKAITTWFGHGIDGDQYKDLAVYDLVFCLSEKFADQSRPHCPHSYCVRSAFDFLPTERPEKIEKKYLFSFMGTSGHGCVAHTERLAALRYLLKKTPLNIWANEPLLFSDKKYHKKRFYKSLFRKRTSALKKIIESGIYSEIGFFLHEIAKLKKEHRKLPSSFFNKNPQLEMPLKYLGCKRVFPAVMGLEYHKKIQQSHIVFNIHTDWKGHGGNFRVFEVAGMGSCLLSDRSELMTDVLEPYKEMVPYTTVHEAIEQYKYLKKNLHHANEIAQRSQDKIFESHLIFHRCKQIKEHITNYLS